MKGFTIVSPALDKPRPLLYIDDAIELAAELAIKFREEMRVFINERDRSTLVAIIFGNKISELQLKPKEIKFLRNKP